METIADQLKERFKINTPDVIRIYPDAPGHITFLREEGGIMIFVFDRASDLFMPAFVIAIPRKDWRIALDLMPDEMITFPTVTWNEFESKTKPLSQQDKV